MVGFDYHKVLCEAAGYNLSTSLKVDEVIIIVMVRVTD